MGSKIELSPLNNHKSHNDSLRKKVTQHKKDTGSQNAVIDEKIAAHHQKLEATVAKVNQHVQSVLRDVNIQISDLTGKSMVSVLDSKTKDVIREIPSDNLALLAQDLHEKSGGIVEDNA